MPTTHERIAKLKEKRRVNTGASLLMIVIGPVAMPFVLWFGILFIPFALIFAYVMSKDNKKIDKQLVALGERGGSSASGKATTGYVRAGAVNWFKGQSIASKLIVVGVIVLLYLTIVRPLALYAGIPSEAFIVISVIVVALLYREMTLSRWLSYTLLILSCAVVLGRLDAAIEAEDSYDADADLLRATLQAGMIDGDEAIRDVEVSGNKATVVVSGVSDAYAESACSFVLGAAPELMLESESNDYAGITEVSVKRPLRLWNAASC